MKRSSIKLLSLVGMLVMFFGLSACKSASTVKTAEVNTPDMGTVVPFDGVSGKVVASGNKTFTYTSTGESLVIMQWPEKTALIVFQSDPGATVNFDPAAGTVSSIKDGNPASQSLPEDYKNLTWVVLEYIR